MLREKERLLYKQALITIVWYIHDSGQKDISRQRLIFASVELIPNYWADEYDSPEDRKSTRNPDCDYYYRRWTTTVDEACAWYENIRKEKALRLPHENTPSIYLFPEEDEHKNLIETPAYPYWATTVNSPIAASNWGCVRISHLTPYKVCSEKPHSDLVGNEEIREWLNARLMFDLNENIDYLSTVNFIAPNPYYCRASLSLSKQKNCGNETAVFSLDRYHENNMLELICCECINGEFANFQKHIIKDRPIIINFAATAEQIGYAVFSQEHDLIDYSAFNSFLRKINFNMAIHGYDVTYRGAKGKKITVEKQRIIEEVSTGTDDIPEIRLAQTKAQLKYDREERKRAENQLLFCQDEDKAADFVRKLINSAVQSLTIIDPYFRADQVIEYLLSVSRRDIEISLFTSSEICRQRDGNTETAEKKLIGLQKKLKEAGHINNLKIFVMTGSPLFHDRFIIIDNKQVWLSGNSLNAIGSRVSSLIKLYNPQEVLERLQTFIENSSEKIRPLECC